MKGGNRKRALLVSSVVILLCMTIIAGMTFALFTDTVKLTNHLQAGTLDITLIRTKLQTLQLDNETGFLVEKTDTTPVDFSNGTNENVFDLKRDVSLIVPGCYYTAEMKLINDNTKEPGDHEKRESNVAYNYWLAIVFENKDNLALADQLDITIETDKGTITKRLNQKDLLNGSAVLGSEANPIGVLPRFGSAIFKVTVTFCDLDNNNAAKTQALDFDLVVHAAQQLRPK